MSTMKKNVPAPAATGVEDNKSIAERSVTTAYLSNWSRNTRDHFGTVSGARLSCAGYVAVLLPRHTVQDMLTDGPQAITINEPCVRAHNAAARAAREKERLARLNNERGVIVKGCAADIEYSVELLDALGTDQWTEQLEHDAVEFLEEVLDRDVSTVTPELLAEARHARRRRRDFQLARLEEEL